MLTELWIGRRYLRRSQKEGIISLTALISVIGIAIGVMVLIVVISVMSGFDIYLQDKMIGTNAHLSLEFFGGTAQTQLFMDALKDSPHISAQAPFISGQAFIRNDSSIIGLDVRGVDPKMQQGVSKIKEYMKQGSFQMVGNEVVIGEELASRLGVGLGNKINLISPATLAPVEFKVKGLFSSGMYLYDAGLILMSIKGAQDFFKLGDFVTGITIKTDDIYQVERVKNDIYNKLGPSSQFRVRTWIDANRNFLQALKLEKIVIFIVVTMTTVVAAFGIVSTLIMSVMSKTKDIGILRAIGAKAKNILAIFIFQGLALGILGIILGLGAGVSLALSLNKIVDFISGLIGRSLIPQDIYYFNRIPTNINTTDVSMIVFCALAISLVASIYPAYYATRINPNEAIRHE